MIYGQHLCMNVVANSEEIPESVLIRALAPTEGIDLMKVRRKTNNLRNLCNGPGKLTQALGIEKRHYGFDLCGEELYIESIDNTAPPVSATKRINVDYSGEAALYPWRFIYTGHPCISVPPRK